MAVAERTIPRCPAIGPFGAQCLKPPTEHSRHHGWWNGVETWWSDPESED